jgi:hypothetical protein
MDENSTIKEIKTFFHDHAKKGVVCPACDQFVKIYERPVHNAMARALMNLYRLNYTKAGYYHIDDFTRDGKKTLGDFAKFRYWGLAVEEPKQDGVTAKKTSGRWAITEKGKNYVLGKISIQKYAIIYNKKKIGYSEEHATIKDALGKKFDYQELMGEYMPKDGISKQTSLL